ncbi:MAG: TlpA family protein disulfide reductase [Nocardioidaceae bacterium]|nr:TlpA family protein disulfide reductase [Nocardioidaceae bacterium]
MTLRETALVGAGVLLAGACSAPPPAEDKPYEFDQQQASVKVDTPKLREQKAAAGIANCPTSDTTAVHVDGGLPALTLPCLGGGRDVQLAGLRGTPTVVNFWAQYCGPCRAEAPLFQQLHEAGGADLAVIGIDWQDRPGFALAFANELGLTYPQIADPDAVTRAPLRVSALPMTMLIDADGKIAHTTYGAIESLTELADLVDRELGVRVDVGPR